MALITTGSLELNREYRSFISLADYPKSAVVEGIQLKQELISTAKEGAYAICFEGNLALDYNVSRQRSILAAGYLDIKELIGVEVELVVKQVPGLSGELVDSIQLIVPESNLPF